MRSCSREHEPGEVRDIWDRMQSSLRGGRERGGSCDRIRRSRGGSNDPERDDDSVAPVDPSGRVV
jgi:hypothetical protein